MAKLNMYETDDGDMIVANSPEDARELFEAFYGLSEEQMMEEHPDITFEMMDINRQITVEDDSGLSRENRTKTVSQWIIENGAGYFAGPNF
jgi:uncharacterized protein YabN with tetrapyrrole methylase and pyrophosphatase domain